MSIPNFTAGYPPDGFSLGATKVQIRNNLDGTFQTLSVDHRDQTEVNPGYHDVIHMVQQGSTPAVVASIGELYSKTITSVISDTALFFQTGTGINIQMTMNLLPLIADNGYTFLPGGLLLQWGKISTPASTGTVLFVTSNIDFPNTLFSVFFNFARNASSTDSFWINSSQTFDKTQFSWRASTGSAATLYWIAIGK